MGIFNQQPNYNQSFTRGKGGITGPQGPPGPIGPPGPAGASGTGFNLTADGNYDMVNKKLASMAEGTTSSDAITKNQLDAAAGNKHNNDQNIDLEDTYNVINSKQQTFIEMNRNRVMRMLEMCLSVGKNLCFQWKLIWIWVSSSSLMSRPPSIVIKG